MSRERSAGLQEAAVVRSVNATQRVRRALLELHKTSEPISFSGVASRANVSRQFLYSHQELRAEIERLRDAHQLRPSALPASERASEASIRTRLRVALEENKRLREDLARIRDELALARGQVRELDLARRANPRHERSSPVGQIGPTEARLTSSQAQRAVAGQLSASE